MPSSTIYTNDNNQHKLSEDSNTITVRICLMMSEGIYTNGTNRIRYNESVLYI